jgi:hypothetical protein
MYITRCCVVNFLKEKRKRKIVIIASPIILILAIVVACAIYVSDYYRADSEAIEAFEPMHKVSREQLEDGTMVFKPENATAGFIFYPGGKVEYTAYQPLMASFAEQGILSVLVEMPFNLAVFDINAADGIQEQYPQIKEWYIGGHSLGGAMAASYVEKHTDDYEGLILLGAYSTADLSDTELKVLSLYGSEDGVMDRTKYEECRLNLPSGAVEIVIEGGCHAYFGMYGEQEGDGVSLIEPKDQIRQSADAIIDIMTS